MILQALRAYILLVQSFPESRAESTGLPNMCHVTDPLAINATFVCSLFYHLPTF